MSETEPYENTLSIKQLRQEVRRCWDREHALRDALREAPEVPPHEVLYLLSSAARYPMDHDKGKEMQRQYNAGVGVHSDHAENPIPYKLEYEGGAGLWWRIRRGLRGETKEESHED